MLENGSLGEDFENLVNHAGRKNAIGKIGVITGEDFYADDQIRVDAWLETSFAQKLMLEKRTKKELGIVCEISARDETGYMVHYVNHLGSYAAFCFGNKDEKFANILGFEDNQIIIVTTRLINNSRTIVGAKPVQLTESNYRRVIEKILKANHQFHKEFPLELMVDNSN